MAKYKKEIEKAFYALKHLGIECECSPLFDGYSIKGVDANGEEWDAVCHSFSNRHNENLLEVLGSVCEEPGYEEVMTANELVRRLLNIERRGVPEEGTPLEAYEAVVAVTGRFRTTVWAHSAEEAKTEAELKFGEADFRDLESVDGSVCYVEDSDGEFYYFD